MLVDVRSVQRYARTAGILIVISVGFGLFGEIYVPLSAGAHPIGSDLNILRLGAASYFVEALCDVTLTLIFYGIFAPVQRSLALLAVFFRLVSTATFGAAELFNFAALLIRSDDPSLGGAFSSTQLNALARFSIDVYAFGGVAPVFYGSAGIVLGYLTYRSGFLPKVLGALWVIGGLGQTVNAFLSVLAPGYAYFWEILPLLLAMIAFAGWLLLRGVDTAIWENRATVLPTS